MPTSTDTNISMLHDIVYGLSEQVDAILSTYKNKHYEQKTDVEAISQCMLQMAYEKMMSVVTLLNNGADIIVDGVLQNIPSFFSQYPIVRSLYELMSIHHSLFVNPKSAEEAQILLDLWKIKGYKLRVKYTNVHQYEEQKAREIKEIESLTDKIKKNSIYMICKEQIEHAIKTDKVGYFEFATKNCKYSLQTTSFGEQLLFNRIFKDLDGMPNIDNDMVYNLLSMNSHPTFLSVLQFGTQSSMDTEQVLLPLKSATFFVYRMIKSHEYLLHNPIFHK
ncbi:MAG: hypothetical protein IJ550_06295 [Bacteroidaceae bacterium]|nr:hypothetical protein [Bacteroidaceae bacterium]